MKTENIKKAKSELEKAWQVADDWKRKYQQERKRLIRLKVALERAVLERAVKEYNG